MCSFYHQIDTKMFLDDYLVYWYGVDGLDHLSCMLEILSLSISYFRTELRCHRFRI